MLGIYLESDILFVFAFWLLQLTASIWERQGGAGAEDKNYKVIEARETKDVRNKIRDRDKNSAEGVVTQFVNWLRLRFHCRGHGFYSWSGKILHTTWWGKIIIIMIINWLVL